jgi:hypothetical protein
MAAVALGTVSRTVSASHLEVSIDDKPAKMTAADFDHETLTINLPPGLGTHTGS